MAGDATRRLHAGHAAILLLEYVAAQFLVSALAGFGARIYARAFAATPATAATLRHALEPGVLAYGAIGGVLLGGLAVIVQIRYWAGALLRDGGAGGVAWTRPPAASLVAAGVIGIVLAWLFVLVLTLAPPDPGALNGPLARLAEGALIERLALAVIALFAAPFIEEFLFRGAMFAAIARSWGATAAIVLTTLAFVALHIPDKWHYWPGFVAVGTLALVAAALRLKFRSLAPAVAVHFAYNLALVVFSASLV